MTRKLSIRTRLHNLLTAIENGFGCRISWILCFDTIAAMVIGSIFLAMKVEYDVYVDWADRACAEVTDQNWHTRYWEDDSRHRCHESVQLNGWPCLVDGTEAAVCRHRSGGIEVDTLVFGHHSRNTIKITFPVSDPRIVYIGEPTEEFFR